MMVRKSSSLRNAHMVNSGIPHGLEEMWHVLGHLPKRSFRKNGIRSWWTSSWISRADSGGPRATADTASLRLVVRLQLSGASTVSERWQAAYWHPGSAEGTPDFRAFGGGGGGALASLRTGRGGAIWGSRHTEGRDEFYLPSKFCFLHHISNILL